MADTDVWGLGGPIAAPAATDRVPIATGAGAGGYSLREEFAWQTAPGSYRITGTEMPMLQLLRSGVGAWTIGYSGTPGDNNFALRYNGGAPTLIVNGTSLGIGTVPAVSLHAKSSGEITRHETTTARGGGLNYSAWYDPTGRAGYTGYGGANNHFEIMNELAGHIVFGTSGANRWQIASNGHHLPLSDNAFDIGVGGSNRIRDLFLVNSPTVTSDEREKTWRGALNSAELAAARRIAAEVGVYQWNDAIAEKGADGARLHVGPRAQRVWGIMADEGLIDPLAEGVTPNSKYAFLCWNRWDAIAPVEAVEEVRDENDNIIVHAQPAQPRRDAGDLFGVRTDELAMFLIAAQEARLAALESA